MIYIELYVRVNDTYLPEIYILLKSFTIKKTLGITPTSFLYFYTCNTILFLNTNDLINIHEVFLFDKTYEEWLIKIKNIWINAN